jgi:hypothetical protein
LHDQNRRREDERDGPERKGDEREPARNEHCVQQAAEIDAGDETRRGGAFVETAAGRTGEGGSRERRQ